MNGGLGLTDVIVTAKSPKTWLKQYENWNYEHFSVEKDSTFSAASTFRDKTPFPSLRYREN